MSLISEALRKAHMEAVRQDRGELRYYIGHGERNPGGHRVSRYGAIMIVLGGLCFATGAALFYLSLRSTPSASPAVAPKVAPALVPSSPASAAASSAAKVQEDAKPPVVEHPRPASTRRASVAAVAPKTPPPRSAPAAIEDTPEPRNTVSSEVVRPKKTVDAAAIVSTEARRTTAPRRMSRDGFQEGETYGSPVLGPFGSEVSLTGITALRGQYVAIVNGSTVRAGTAIGPFVIEEIEARRIRLRYVDITFFVVQ